MRSLLIFLLAFSLISFTYADSINVINTANREISINQNPSPLVILSTQVPITSGGYYSGDQVQIKPNITKVNYINETLPIKSNKVSNTYLSIGAIIIILSLIGGFIYYKYYKKEGKIYKDLLPS
jgi:hypothetical protein